MKPKAKQVIVISSMIIMAVIIGVCVLKNDDLFPKNNVWNSKCENTEIQEYENLILDSEFDDGKTSEIGDDIFTGDLTFTVNSIEKTKEIEKFPKPLNYEQFVTDEKGNLINNMSYAIINVTIKNNKEDVRTFPLNSCWLDVMDHKNEVCNYKCIMYSYLDGFENEDYFEYDFQPKEEYPCDLIFILEDEKLQYNNLTFNIFIPGDINYNDDLRHVKINY